MTTSVTITPAGHKVKTTFKATWDKGRTTMEYDLLPGDEPLTLYVSTGATIFVEEVE